MKVVKILEETIRLDEDENGLIARGADEDGFFISETIGKGKIYVYYAEIEKLEQLIRKVKYSYNNRYTQHSPSSQKEKPSNDNELYKSFGDVRKFHDYNRYINSDEWKVKSSMRKSLDGNRCRNCGSKHGLEVHHKTYSGLGNEDVKDDLVTLCSDCHKKITFNDRRRRRGVVTEFS